MQNIQADRCDGYPDPPGLIQEGALERLVCQRQPRVANTEAYLDAVESDLLCQREGFELGCLTEAPIRHADLEPDAFCRGKRGNRPPRAGDRGRANTEKIASIDAHGLSPLLFFEKLPG